MAIKKAPDKFFTDEVKRVVYCNANAKCQNPNCGMYLEYKGGCAEFAHIYGREPGSARYSASKKEAFIGSHKNGLLLCSNCHTLIDKHPDDFTVGVLNGWNNNLGKKSKKIAIGVKIIRVEASASLL